MERLEKLVQYINENDIVADIGCDHGYLLKLAIDEKKIKKCYAIDNKVEPLNSAKNNLKKYNCVEYVLSDGLKNITSNDINCVVIAGMGGVLITQIIDDSINKFKNIDKMILCPNRNSEKIRKYLCDNNFSIVDEEIIYEDNKYYETIVVKHGIMKLTEKEIIFGPILLKNKDDNFLSKWNIYYNKIKDIPLKKREAILIEEVLNESK